MAESIAQHVHKLERIAQFPDRAVMVRVGRPGARDATNVIVGAIGDRSMSHFSRRSPADLTVNAYVKSDTEIVFGPDRRSVGPSSVLSAGHQAYRKGDRRLTGKVSKKTGKALSRKVKRTTGGHGGKGTAPEGNRLIAERTPKRLHDEYVKVLRREFRG